MARRIRIISVGIDDPGFGKMGGFFETPHGTRHTNAQAEDSNRQFGYHYGDREAALTSGPEDRAITWDPSALAALRRQDAAAFSRLVETHERIVVGLGQSMGLRGADLDDAAAETFAAVYRALPKFEARSALSTWVYQIACRTFWRLRARRDANPTAALQDNRADERQISPQQTAEASEESELIWSAVAQLEPKQAMAVELHYRRGFPVEEIAVVMECPEGTIKTLLFRARERLRQRLARKFGSVDRI